MFRSVPWAANDVLVDSDSAILEWIPCLTEARAMLAIFSSSFFRALPFLRSVTSKSCTCYCKPAISWPDYSRSFTAPNFWLASKSPPSWPPSCWPMGSFSEAPSIAEAVSEEVEGGCPETGPVFSPATIVDSETVEAIDQCIAPTRIV